MHILEVKNLGINFGGLRAVDNFNLTIEDNRLYGLIGPNGAGKTTVFNMLTGVYQPNDGEIYLNGKLLNKLPCHKITELGIARTFQNIRLFKNMTVIDNVKIGLHHVYRTNLFNSLLKTNTCLKDELTIEKEALDLLKVFKLDHLAYVLASNLPYGKQRKLEIARSLATNPKLLLLDEPAAGMNPNETIELMNTIKFVRDTFDMTILLIEHDMKLVSGICEELTVLNFGRVLAQGETSEVLNNPQVITAYLGE